MKKHLLTFGLLIWLASLSHSALALSLGEMNVKSSFAQPFYAEIAIPSYTEEEIETLDVQIAPANHFDARGIVLLPLFQEFKFEIKENEKGKFVIAVTSAKPVKELSMSFLLEVTWLGGRIIKDFDVLLTPEAITQIWDEREKSQIAVQPPEREPEEIVAISEPVKTPSQETQVTTPVSRPSEPQENNQTALNENQANRLNKTNSGGLRYSPVGEGESLSKIAQRIRPDKSISLNQMMVALYEQNRTAFVNENINKLKAGSELSIDSVDSITRISKREAFQLAQQYLFEPGKRQQNSETMLAKDDQPVNTFEEEKPKNRLEISSVSEDAIPPEIMEELKQEQIESKRQNLESVLEANKELEKQNNLLREKIAQLEAELNATAEQLFIATVESEEFQSNPLNQDSVSQQGDNLLVMNSDLAVDKSPEHLTLMDRFEQHRTLISLSGATLMTLGFVAMRKKNQILQFIDNLKNRNQPDSLS